jgi:hypothetical protein
MKQAFVPLLLISTILVAQQSASISLLALIATPDRYHDKQVTVSGFMYLQREHNALYVTKSDFQHALFKNAVYLQVSNELFERFYALNGCYVEVQGKFDAKNTGHMGAFSGELLVKQVVPVSTLTVPAHEKDTSVPGSCRS